MKKKRKFNKKLLMFLLPVLAIGFVVAGAIFYNVFSATFNVTPAITVGGDLVQELGYVDGGVMISGDPITLTSNGDSAMEVSITNDANEEPNNGDVEVSYVGALELTKKEVNFAEDVWVIPSDADKVQIEYTVVGDEFNAEVTDEDVENTGYVLIYYADAADRFVNPEEAILIESVSENLPYAIDENAEGGDYDYCSTLEYDTCHGAKIWYVPSNAILSGGELDWSRADEFYFESSLIQYNAEGQITVYPEEVLDFIPEYTPSVYADGEYTITTEVA